MLSSQLAKELATDGVVPEGVDVGFKDSRRVLDDSDHLNGLFYEMVQIIRTGGKTTYKPVEQPGITAEKAKSFSDKLNQEVHALIDNLKPLVLESVPVGTDVDGSTICAPFALLKKTNPRIIDAVFSAVEHPPKTTWRFLKKYSGLVSPGSRKFQTALEQVPMDSDAQLFPLQVMLANSSSWNMQFFEVSPGVTKFTLGTRTVEGKSGRTYTHPTLEVRVPALDKSSRWATPEEIAAVQQFLKTNSPVKTKKKTTVAKPSSSNVPLLVKIRNTFARLTSTTCRKTWQDLAEQNTVKTFQPCFDFILATFDAIAEARGVPGASKMTGADTDLILTRTVLQFGNVVVRKPNLADIAAYNKAMMEFEAESAHPTPGQTTATTAATTTTPPVASLGLQFKFSIWRRIKRVILPAFYACTSDKLVHPRDVARTVSKRLALSHPKPVVTVNRVESGALTPKQAAVMDYAREHLQLGDLSATLLDEETAQQAADAYGGVVFIDLGTRSGPDVRDLTTGPAVVKCYVGAEKTTESSLPFMARGPVCTGRTCRDGSCTTVKFQSTAGTLGASIVGDATHTVNEKDLSDKQLAQHHMCMAFLKRRLYAKRLPWHEGFIRVSDAKPTDKVETPFGRPRFTSKYCMTLAGFQAFVARFPDIRVSVGVTYGWFGFATTINHPELFQTPVHVHRMTGYLTEPERVSTGLASDAAESTEKPKPRHKYNLFNLDDITSRSPYVPVQSILACDGKVLIVPPGVCPTPTDVGFAGDTTLITPRLSEVFGATGLCSDLRHRLRVSGMPSGPLSGLQAFQAAEKNWVAGFMYEMSPSKKAWARYGAPKLEFTDGVTVCCAALMPDAFEPRNGATFDY